MSSISSCSHRACSLGSRCPPRALPSSRQHLPPCYNLLVSNAPAAAKLAGAFLLPSRSVDPASMVNVNDKNDENIVLDIDNDSIVSDPVAPKTGLVLGQALAHAPRVFELRNLTQLRNDSLGYLPVQLLHRALDILINLNPPGQGFPPARPASQSQACQL